MVLPVMLATRYPVGEAELVAGIGEEALLVAVVFTPLIHPLGSTLKPRCAMSFCRPSFMPSLAHSCAQKIHATFPGRDFRDFYVQPPHAQTHYLL